MQTTGWMVVARLLRPQGRKGQLLAELLTDFPERFADRPEVWLGPAGFAESGVADDVAKLRQAAVESFFLPVGRKAGRIVLALAGVTSIEAAERLAGMEVVVPASERVELEEDAAYIDELVGCTVYDGDRAVGVVDDVQFATTADGARRLEDAAPLLALSTEEGDEVLVPFVKAYLVEIDLVGRKIRMALPEGLIEVNR